MTIRERFEAKYSRVGECDVWIGAKTQKGYGIFSFRGNAARAHRVAWELQNGPIPADMLVLHTCDNPSCVRIDHLYIGTAQNNTDDMISKERGRNGREGIGVVHGTRHTYSYYGCRCDECREARKEYYRAHRQ